MSEVLSRGGVALLKREKASLVAATGLIFERLKAISQDISLEDSLISYKGGTWGDESTEGVGYPVLRSSNMRGKRVDVSEAAWCEISNKQAEAFSLESGDILVTKSSGSFDLVGKAALFDDPNDGNLYLFSNFTMRLRPDRKKVIPEYLAWFLRSPQALSWRFENQQTTVGLRNLQTKEYLKQVLPVPLLEIQEQVVNYLNAVENVNKESETAKLPEALEEQRHVVVRIEALAARIAKAKYLREEISEEIELLLAAELKKLRYELLDGKFSKRKLGDVTQVTAGGTPSRDNPSYWNGNIPWIRTGELLDGDIYSSGEHITEEGMKNSSAKLFPKETILIALYGQGQTRGRTGRLMIEATTNQACCAILPTPDLLEPRFTQYWLRSLYYEMREQNHGGAQPNLNSAMIKNIEISIPPLDEQRRIVAYLDSVQARLASLRELQSATGEELDALLPSVLDRAFKGEL